MSFKEQLSQSYKHAYTSVRANYPAIPVDAEATIKDFAERLTNELGFARYELAILDASPPDRRISIDGNYRAYATIDGNLAFVICWSLVPDNTQARSITLRHSFTVRGNNVEIEIDNVPHWVNHKDPAGLRYCIAQLSPKLLSIAEKYGLEHARTDLKNAEVTGRLDANK